jgi:hypothetical protein
MKPLPGIIAAALVFSACSSQKKVVFQPEAGPVMLPKQEETAERWQLLESRNGIAGAFVPDWVNRFLEEGIPAVEASGLYQDKYVFIGENRGTNFNALRQWAEGFTVSQDLPGLVTRRVEHRLLAAASLYPDDEYGEYFETLIKKVSNTEYGEAHKEDIFWVRRRMVSGSEAPVSGETPPGLPPVYERYEFLVLISIDKPVLQNRIRELMAGIKTTAAPTREQAVAINHIQHTFFEEF